jgi:LiaF transmembrane domain
MATMRPPQVRRLSLSRLWWGLVFLTAGVLGILAVADVVDWGSTVGDWWPLAFIGWAVTEMIGARRLTLSGAIIVAIGLGVLADNLEWPSRGIVWSALFLGIGIAILWSTRTNERTSTTADAPSWWARRCRWCC